MWYTINFFLSLPSYLNLTSFPVQFPNLLMPNPNPVTTYHRAILSFSATILLQTHIRILPVVTRTWQWHPPRFAKPWRSKGWRRHLNVVGLWWTGRFTGNGAILCGDWGGLACNGGSWQWAIASPAMEALWFMMLCAVCVRGHSECSVMVADERRRNCCGGKAIFSPLLFIYFVLVGSSHWFLGAVAFGFYFLFVGFLVRGLVWLECSL